MVADWGSFGATVGASSGALVGLLFVAVSLNIAHIAGSPGLRARAARTLVLFAIPLVTSLLLVTPDQASRALAVELLAAGAAAGLVLIFIGRGDEIADESRESRLARTLDRTTPNIVTCVLIGIAGLTLIIGTGGGLYWLVPAMILALLGGIFNAWLLLTRLPLIG